MKNRKTPSTKTELKEVIKAGRSKKTTTQAANENRNQRPLHPDLLPLTNLLKLQSPSKPPKK